MLEVEFDWKGERQVVECVERPISHFDENITLSDGGDEGELLVAFDSDALESLSSEM